MPFETTYSVRIPTNQYKKVFIDTTALFRKAVDFFIPIYLENKELFRECEKSDDKEHLMEHLTIKTKERKTVPYDFGEKFYKFPSYYRRAAIRKAIGFAESYLSNLANWEKSDKRGKRPGIPKAGYCYPALYRGNTFVRVDDLCAEVKVFIRNTWDWVRVPLRKCDVDYITHHCSDRTECTPTLQKRGKVWSLDFSFKKSQKLHDIPIKEQVILAVDLGINCACVCSAMKSDGTILGRRFLHLSREEDSLKHILNRIKQAQQHGARKMPRLWAWATGMNDRIAVLTARYIIDTAVEFDACTIVFEHLDTKGKKKGGRRKQRLHHWKAQYVQAMVESKAHHLGKRVSRVNAWGTSRLAFDGSGNVLRGKDANLGSYSVCQFPDNGEKKGKIYNCDLNAAYNIGARYFIREILKSESEKTRLDIGAKVPQCSKRSTCTLSTLISLNAALAS